MQILHPFSGLIQDYSKWEGKCEGPKSCALCGSKRALKAHGFYSRTAVDVDWEGVIWIPRFLCRACRRTISLLPGCLLPYWRFTIRVMASFLNARLGEGQPLKASAEAAHQPEASYQRGQHWVRRFTCQAETLSASLASIARPPVAAPSFVAKALTMLNEAGWVQAHRFLFGQVHAHLLGWPRWLAPAGLGVRLRRAVGSGAGPVQSTCVDGPDPPA